MIRFTVAVFVLVVSSVTHAAPSTVVASPTAPKVTTNSAVPIPSPQAGKGALMMGEAALKAGLVPKCVELAKEAVRSGQLDVDNLAAAWLLRGRCHALEGDADRAERSYAVATRIKPTIMLGAADTIWQRVQPEGTAAATALVLIPAGIVVAENDVGIEVTTQDDLVLGHTVVVVDKDGVELARAPLLEAIPATATTPATPPPVRAVRHRFSGFAVVGTTTKLLDRNGNVLRSAAVELDERAQLALAGPTATSTSTMPTPGEQLAQMSVGIATMDSAPGVLAYVGGGAAVVGFVAAAICGIQWAETARVDPDNTNDNEMPFVAGTIAGALVMAVGAGVVVVERL